MRTSNTPVRKALHRVIGLAFTLAAATAATVHATTISLGEAGDYAVLSLNNTFLNLSNVTITGNTGVGPSGSVSLMSPSTVNGILFVDPTAHVNTTAGSATGGIQTASLTQAVTDARNAAAAFSALTPTISLGSINTALTLNRTGTDTVISLNGGINLSGGNLTLNGGANDYFIFNVKGGLQMGGSSEISLTGGLTADHVLFNFLTASQGGSGDLMTHVDNIVRGTILALDRDITFHGAFGEIIGGGTNLTLMSGAKVVGQPFTPPMTPVPETNALLPLLGVLGLAIFSPAIRRRFAAQS